MVSLSDIEYESMKCDIQNLKNENAELKKTVFQFQKDSYCGVCHFKTKTQLAKAKEIIKKFLLWENDWHNKSESKYELLKQAENFLKEIE